MKIIHIQGSAEERAADKKSDRRSADERADDERYENFLVHFDDPVKRKRYRPPWQDAETVVRLFRDETLGDWLQDHLHKFPDREQEALDKANWGDLTDLIRMASKKGHGERGPESKWKRALRSGVHFAAAILPDVEYLLRWVYPERSSKDIRDRALMVARDMVGNSVSVDTIAKYLSRPRKDRRRLV